MEAGHDRCGLRYGLMALNLFGERIATLTCAVLFVTLLLAQTAPNTYWVQFTTKENTPYSLSQPDQFLSQRALARRAAQGVALDDLDLPVDPSFVNVVEALEGVEVLNRSKWFNAVTVRISDPNALAAIQGLPFVQVVRGTGSNMVQRPTPVKFLEPPADSSRDVDAVRYGSSYLQFSMLNGQALHGIDAKGQGMLIGVLDSGFDGVDSALAFQGLRDRGGILLVRDLVAHDGDVYQDHWHGRSVLSCMAAVLDSQLIGTAPEADYVLLRTEEVATEYPVEEDNWISGAELADSLGCDVLNTSLGYTAFDDSTMDHTYAQLDGQTLRISVAANIASRKGMIPVCSAGNSGSSEWFYISAPADAIDVLTVGAVGDVENSAPFSSRGPSADGRVKPDVCAMGWWATVLRSNADSVLQVNGTSFSSPILAGLVACLWQLHPERTASEIMDAVRRSASFFSNPNDSLGYGVPDFGAAHAWLMMIGIPEGGDIPALKVYPNPFQQELSIQTPEMVKGAIHLAMFNTQGQLVYFSRERAQAGDRIRVEASNVASLLPGAYVIKLQSADLVWQQQVIKLP